MVKAYTLKNQLQVESHGCQMPISPNEIDAVSAYPVAGTQPLRSKGISISTEELCESATVIEPTRRIPSPMHNTKTFALASAFILTLAAPALASVTVNSPATGSDVSSPFKLEATASTCSSQGVSSMGYSLDSSSDTTVVDGTEVNATVAAGAGSHTIHVKAWGDKGSSCVEDVTVTVGTAATSTSLVPSDAKSVSSIQAMGNWKASNDSAASGHASGSTSIVSSPSRGGTTRRFVSKFSSNGGERYNVSFADDESATNFLYDGWIYLTSSSSVANIEMDLNQVMSNGHTIIYGFQCDGWSGTWDYTKNAGSTAKPKDAWVHSKQACNPHKWKVDAWHHVQISYSRSDSGAVTYKSVWLDDKEQTINATVPSAFALGWGPTLLTNFQIDGDGSSGTSTVYMDDLVIYRW
jgi:hypothetical protein